VNYTERHEPSGGGQGYISKKTGHNLQDGRAMIAALRELQGVATRTFTREGHRVVHQENEIPMSLAGGEVGSGPLLSASEDVAP